MAEISLGGRPWKVISPATRSSSIFYLFASTLTIKMQKKKNQLSTHVPIDMSSPPWCQDGPELRAKVNVPWTFQSLWHKNNTRKKIYMMSKSEVIAVVNWTVPLEIVCRKNRESLNTWSWETLEYCKPHLVGDSGESWKTGVLREM